MLLHVLVSPRKCVLVFVMLTLGCTASVAQKVKTTFDKSVDFSRFRTYAWREHPIFEKHPELKEQFAVARDLVVSSVNQGLTQKGFSRADDSPSFYVTFFITVKGMQDVQTTSLGGWYGWSSFWYPSWTEVTVTDYLQGTLVLDFIEGSDKQLAWRAICRDDIRDMKTRHENIEKAVKKALKKFPPKA